MKLATLLEYQRMFEMMRSAELTMEPLPSKQFIAIYEVKAKFDLELEKITDIEVEVQA